MPVTGLNPEHIAINANNKRSSKMRSDALIVAALMGNSSGFSNNINNIISEKKKLQSQVSSPGQLNISPVFQGDLQSQKSFTTESKSKVKMDNFMAINPHFEMSALSQSQGPIELAPNSFTNNSSSLSPNKNNIKVTSASTKASKCNTHLYCLFFLFCKFQLIVTLSPR